MTTKQTEREVEKGWSIVSDGVLRSFSSHPPARWPGTRSLSMTALLATANRKSCLTHVLASNGGSCLGAEEQKLPKMASTPSHKQVAEGR